MSKRTNIEIASIYLEKKGYEIIERRIVSENGVEIVVVADENNTVAFVAVGNGDSLDGFVPDRTDMEHATISLIQKIAAENETIDFTFRFDVITMKFVADDGVVLRHYINALGKA